MSRTHTNLITLGIMLSLFLASMEGTVVATAMPSIVAQLGGLSIYSWVFSMYMLTSTTTLPIYGKLSDLYGRKLVYTISMSIFLVGSVLCAQARTMEQLIFFRALQGLGAGGVLPLAFTIVGELFSLEQRTRMQGLFSGVWGVSSVVGPLIGGFLVDKVSWQWVFYINVIPGLFAIGLVWIAWKDRWRDPAAHVHLDLAGVILLTLGVLTLLLGLNELGTGLSWLSLSASAVFLLALFWVERRAVDPILPLKLFKARLFNAAVLHGVFAGWAVFGSISYVPLFVQAVIGTTATQAGLALTPMSLGWTLASIFGSRLLLRVGYRNLALFGMAVLAFGSFLMMGISIHSSTFSIMLYTSLMGVGMGLSVPAFLIAVQSTVLRSDLGAATSAVQFSRNIGGTLGVSLLGAVLSSGLANRLLAANINPASVSLGSLLDPLSRSSAALGGSLRQALGLSIASMFIYSFAAACAGLLAVLIAPGGKLSQLPPESSPQPHTAHNTAYPAPDIPSPETGNDL